MPQKVTFGSVFNDTEQLTLDDQEALIEVLRRRTAELRRQQIVDDVHDAEAEFSRGECKRTTVADLMAEILQ